MGGVKLVRSGRKLNWSVRLLRRVFLRAILSCFMFLFTLFEPYPCVLIRRISRSLPKCLLHWSLDLLIHPVVVTSGFYTLPTRLYRILPTIVDWHERFYVYFFLLTIRNFVDQSRKIEGEITNKSERQNH